MFTIILYTPDGEAKRSEREGEEEWGKEEGEEEWGKGGGERRSEGREEGKREELSRDFSSPILLLGESCGAQFRTSWICHRDRRLPFSGLFEQL